MAEDTETALRRILLVEDDPDIRQVAKLALEALGGFTVLPCGSGPEALAALAATGGFSPDLVLLDVMMPGMDGPQALQALRRIPGGERLPAVFMTARVQAEEVAGYRAMGAADVIAKPFDPMRLAETVLGIWKGLPRSSPADESRVRADDLDEIRQSFGDRLAERVREIAEAWEAARTAPGSPEPLRRLHRLAHSLHGAAGTFGHPAAGDAAHALERRAKELLDAGRTDVDDIAELAPLLAALQRSAGKLP